MIDFWFQPLYLSYLKSKSCALRAQFCLPGFGVLGLALSLCDDSLCRSLTSRWMESISPWRRDGTHGMKLQQLNIHVNFQDFFKKQMLVVFKYLFGKYSPWRIGEDGHHSDEHFCFNWVVQAPGKTAKGCWRNGLSVCVCVWKVGIVCLFPPNLPNNQVFAFLCVEVNHQIFVWPLFFSLFQRTCYLLDILRVNDHRPTGFEALRSLG